MIFKESKLGGGYTFLATIEKHLPVVVTGFHAEFGKHEVSLQMNGLFYSGFIHKVLERKDY